MAEGDRIGPLSYDLTAPKGETGTERAVVYAVLAMAAILVAGLVGGWLILGVVAKAAYVVEGVPFLLIAVPLLIAWRLTTYSLKRTRLRAMVFVLLIAMGASFLTYRSLSSLKPAMPQVKYALDSLDFPAGYRLLDQETHGDRFCRNGCPTVERHYAAPIGDADPVRTVVLEMFQQGWHKTSDVADADATVAAKDGITAQLQADNHVLRIVAVRNS